MSTPNLKILDAQNVRVDGNNAFSVFNGSMSVLESVITDRHTIAITGDYTLSSFESYLFNLNFTSSTLTAEPSINLETTINIVHLIDNNTNKRIHVKTATDTISVNSSDTKLIYNNIDELIELPRTGYSPLYISNFFKSGTATNSEDILIFPIAVNCEIESSSIAMYSNTAAFANTVYDIFLDSSKIGTALFSASIKPATISIPTKVNASIGQTFKITTPSSADGSIADIGINLELGL